MQTSFSYERFPLRLVLKQRHKRTRNLSTRLRGITAELLEVSSPDPRAEVYCVWLNLIYGNWSIYLCLYNAGKYLKQCTLTTRRKFSLH